MKQIFIKNVKKLKRTRKNKPLITLPPFTASQKNWSALTNAHPNGCSYEGAMLRRFITVTSNSEKGIVTCIDANTISYIGKEHIYEGLRMLTEILMGHTP
jgi:hypothetical protein